MLSALVQIPIACLFHHLYATRMDAGGRSDLCSWIERDLNLHEAARRSSRLDLYLHTLEDIRKMMSEIVRGG